MAGTLTGGVLLCLAVAVSGHSWLTCTDYLEENGDYYDHALCRGWPRASSRFAPKGKKFGTDTGYNHQPTENSVCKAPRNDKANYDDDHPAAVYYSGQKVIITHPTKNHVADKSCTNQWIPDNSNKILMGFKDASSDLTFSEYRKNEIIDLGVSKVGKHFDPSYPRPGFQNAQKFCENPDKALATFNFILPELNPGRYTFVWLWEFNSGIFYASCWEADLVSSKGERDNVLKAQNMPTSDPVNVSPYKTSFVATPNGLEVMTPGPVVTEGPVTPGRLTPGVTQGKVTPGVGPEPMPSVDGGWSQWSDWSDCNKQCGGGVQRVTRHCVNPRPQNGGEYCVGPDSRTQSCNTHKCPDGTSPNGNTLDIKWTSNWKTGANGAFNPPKFTQTKHEATRIKIQFPCKVDSVMFWHADDISSQDQKKAGTYILKRHGWHNDKVDVGFTVFFGSCTAARNTTEIKVTPIRPMPVLL